MASVKSVRHWTTIVDANVPKTMTAQKLIFQTLNLSETHVYIQMKVSILWLQPAHDYFLNATASVNLAQGLELSPKLIYS